MNKLIVIALVLIVPCFCFADTNPYILGSGVESGACSDTPSAESNLGATDEIVLGYNDNSMQVGSMYSGTSTFDVCEYTASLREVAGDVSSHSYIAYAYSTVGGAGTNLDTLIGTSDTISGSTITSSYTDILFTFSSSVTISQDDTIVIKKTGTSDSTNYIRVESGSGISDWLLQRYDINGTFYTSDGTKDINFAIYEVE